MRRFAILLTAVVAAVLISPDTGIAQKNKGITLGEKFEGELGGRKSNKIRYRLAGEFIPQILGGGQESVYTASIPVTLKAGQAISITATVTGKDRIVGIQVFDPTQQRIGVPKPLGIVRFGADSETLASVKTHTLSLEEVNASGKYTIVVFSDKIGPYTLKAANDSEEEEATEDRETLEQQLKDAKKKVEQLEAKLKAMDEKPKPKKK